MRFNPHLETVVNGSFIRVDCGENETHFLYLPYRAKRLAEIKDEKIKEKRRVKGSTSSSSSSSSSAKPSIEHFNVFAVGLDSASRMNSIRHLSKTRKYLLEELDAIEFLGYNKVGLNTLPNWSAMHTGWPLYPKSQSWGRYIIFVPALMYN